VGATDRTLNKSSLTLFRDEKQKARFLLFYIFQSLSKSKNGDTSMYHGDFI
jgi:hypothetical protein